MQKPLKIVIGSPIGEAYICHVIIRSVYGLISLVCMGTLVGACHNSAGDVQSSFYYWKTVYRPDSVERHALNTIGANRLFIRIMDVDTQGPDGEAVPVSAVMFTESLPDTVSVVPVVYLVNHVLYDLPHDQQDSLAARIYRFVAGKVQSAGKRGFSELQIDCDWTTATRDTYFSLLESMRAQLDDSIRLTATLRLHQVRNRRSSGIPPVDRVLLMCYNMGNLRLPGEHNSILDLREMDTYLNGYLSDYPLPVDIALPLFSWSVVFRDGKYAGISKRLDPRMLSDTTHFAHTEGSSLYRLKESLPEAGLRKDDVVRREETRWEELLAAADFLATHRRKEDFTLLFYHLDNQVLHVFSDEQLQEIIDRF